MWRRLPSRPHIFLTSWHGLRFYSGTELPAVLKKDLVSALKAKDRLKATTIRSVLADITNLEKSFPNKELSSSQILVAVRKAHDQRINSAKQFEDASRRDLADTERQEAQILASYLPPLLSPEKVEEILRDIIAESPLNKDAKQARGLILKSFFSKVDKTTVSAELVKEKVLSLLS